MLRMEGIYSLSIFDGLVFGFPMSERSLYYFGITIVNNDLVLHDALIQPVYIAKLENAFANYGHYV